ncbi:hypothetical protein [Thalassococcus sp. S3]|uniref:hypothetical protein n=1 Tax=Thalassococcus sp. S3 TaxID=2017482 RepID=UPI00102471A1|nr:hypothetical protein [Thalassococcus sp. S3]QBF32317.1 hypothetical protein CFI11_13990 [Thalassococcus sp. S3]
MRFENPRVKDAKSGFEAIEKHAVGYYEYVGRIGKSNDILNHFQGVARWSSEGRKKERLYVTRNDANDDYGRIGVYDDDDYKLVNYFDTPDKGYNHPGGIQAFGDFLVVAIETGKYDKSVIRFYSMVEHTKHIELLDVKITEDYGAGAAGITRYHDETLGEDRYVLASYDNGDVTVYLSNGATIIDSDIEFNKLFKTEIDKDKFSGISLLTDDNDQVFLIGFYSTEDIAYTDYAILYSVDLDKQAFERIDKRHFITRDSEVVPSDQTFLGVHFRWSGGLRITSDGSMQLYTTARNYIGSGSKSALEVNKFRPEKDSF